MNREPDEKVLMEELKPIIDWPGKLTRCQEYNDYLVFDWDDYDEKPDVFMSSLKERFDKGEIVDIDHIKERRSEAKSEMNYFAHDLRIETKCLFYFFLWAKDYVDGLFKSEADKSAENEFGELIAEMEKLNFGHPAKRMRHMPPYRDQNNDIQFRLTDKYVMRENKHKYEIKDDKGGELVFQVGKNNHLRITNPNTLHAILCALKSYQQNEFIDGDITAKGSYKQLWEKEKIYYFYKFAHSFLSWYKAEYGGIKPAGGFEFVIQYMAWVTCLTNDDLWTQRKTEDKRRPLNNVIGQFGRKKIKKPAFVLKSRNY